jgi:hypothetical protein
MITYLDCGFRYEITFDACSVLANGLRSVGEVLELQYCPNCGSDRTEDGEEIDA